MHEAKEGHMSQQSIQLEQVIRNHIAAFNAQNLYQLLAGFTEDAVWRTGKDTFRGREEFAQLFSEAFRTITPSLTIRSMVIGQDQVACELLESMTTEGIQREDAIAGFYRVDAHGMITSATIYREGSADV